MKELKDTKVIRADSELEAKSIIEDYRKAQAENGYSLVKASYAYKAKKAKKEIVDEAWVVSVEMLKAELWEDALDE